MTDIIDNYNELSSLDLVNAVVAQDKDTFMQAFNNAMSQKVMDTLELKKVEVASNLITPQEAEIDEFQTVEAEVDGSIDDASAAEESSQES